MPTELPVRAHSQKPDVDQTNTGWCLLIFYVSAGLAVLLLMNIEARAGMFGGLSRTEIHARSDWRFLSHRWDRAELVVVPAVIATGALE